MTIRDIIFLLIGLAGALLLVWFLFLKKFFKFISNEIDHNEEYRFNAKEDLQKSNEPIAPDAAENKNENDEEFTKW